MGDEQRIDDLREDLKILREEMRDGFRQLEAKMEASQGRVFVRAVMQ